MNLFFLSDLLLLTFPISFKDVVLFSPLLFEALLFRLLAPVMLKFFQEGEISVPLIPRDLVIWSVLIPDLRASLTNEDIPFSDLQLFSDNSSILWLFVDDFVSPVITFVKLLLLLRLLDLPFEIVEGIPLSSVMLLFAVLWNLN